MYKKHSSKSNYIAFLEVLIIAMGSRGAAIMVSLKLPVLDNKYIYGAISSPSQLKQTLALFESSQVAAVIMLELTAWRWRIYQLLAE